MSAEITRTRANCSEIERRFAEEFDVDYNVKAASFRAGINPNTGYKYRDLAHVGDYIIALEAEKKERTGMTADRLMYQAGLLAFSNILDYTSPNDDDPTMLDIDLSAMTREQGAAVQELKVKVLPNGVTITTLKLAPKQPAIELMGKYLGMFVERHKVDGTININISQDDAAV